MPFSRLREPASARCRFPSTVFRGRNGLFKKGCPAPSERSENMLWHRSVSYFSAATWLHTKSLLKNNLRFGAKREYALASKRKLFFSSDLVCSLLPRVQAGHRADFLFRRLVALAVAIFH